MSGNKYGNRKTEVDGIVFDSAAEARRYRELRLMQQAGCITALEVHPQYVLEVNRVVIGRYRPDFRYREQDGTLMVEDVKSRPTKTEAYRLRKKLMKALFDIEVHEIG